MNNLIFSERLQETLRIRKMKQSDLSEKTGIHHGTISNYVLGKYAPKNDKLVKIADALGVSVSYLAGFSDDPTPTGDPGLDGFLDQFTRMTQPGSFGNVSITPEEFDLVCAFRNADPAIQAAVEKLLDLKGDKFE